MVHLTLRAIRNDNLNYVSSSRAFGVRDRDDLSRGSLDAKTTSVLALHSLTQCLRFRAANHARESIWSGSLA